MCPGVALPVMGCALSHLSSVINQQNGPVGQSGGGILSAKVSSSQTTLSCVKLGIKLASTVDYLNTSGVLFAGAWVGVCLQDHLHLTFVFEEAGFQRN